jgi:hypothetical protein
MSLEVTELAEHARARLREFVESEVAPHAELWEQHQEMPEAVIRKVRTAGYWGALVGSEFGGLGMNMISYGLLQAEFGRASISLSNMLTVQSIVARILALWGSRLQQEYWLPRLAQGVCIASFALTEPEAGSDARAIKTVAIADKGGFVLNGVKRWITSGAIANLIVVIAQYEGRPTAFLVRGETAGLERKPIVNIIGTRASMLAELRFEQCRIDADDMLGRAGLGYSHVATSAFDCGRYAVAWCCAGAAESCLDASLEYAGMRTQFGCLLAEHQLIQRMVAQMSVNVRATRLLCQRAGELAESRDARAGIEICAAKYFATKTLASAATDAVQIHGANGCSANFPVARYYRDAKVMEILEGSNEIQEILLAKHDLRDLRRSRTN